jgi:hypothetical protein
MEWSWPSWFVSVIAVIVSGAIAWLEGNWAKRRGLAMGFANHGGMWSDLVLLPFANAVIVPYLTVGAWLVPAVTLSTIASVLVHRHWYAQAPQASETRGNHMWPGHDRQAWWADLSWSGWAHVLYVIGELGLLAGFLVHDTPVDVIVFAAIVFTIHVPIGLLQPRYFLTGHIATIEEQPLLAPCLAALWVSVTAKLLA